MRKVNRTVWLIASVVVTSTVLRALPQSNAKSIDDNTRLKRGSTIVTPFTDSKSTLDDSSSELDTVAVYDIGIRGAEVWLATAKGAMFTSNFGVTWLVFDSSNGIGKGAVTGLSTSPSSVWLSTSYDTAQTRKGSGLAVTSNHGANWLRFQQPMDDPADTTLLYFGQHIPALPIVTDVRNVTYEIAQTDSSVFIASWGGGLRKSTDGGNSWQRVLLPGDTMTYINSSNATHVGRLDPRLHNNHQTFSVLGYDAGGLPFIWTGTAGGVNKSTDGGLTWRKYNPSSTGMCGSWVVALHRQSTLSQDIIWASSWLVNPDESNGINFTTNSGASWQSSLIGKRAYGFSSLNDTLYVSSDSGLYRSTSGARWQRFSPTGSNPVYDAIKDTISGLWVGTENGLHMFQDNDTLWHDAASLGTPPQIVSVVAPTIFARPSTGFLIDSAWIQTTDPDGLADVVSAWFHAYLPNRSSTRILLQNWGDGKFGVRFRLDSSAQLGTHRWVFFAKDLEGNLSDSVTHFITVVVASVEESQHGLPSTFFLDQNHPNPFNPSTTIKFAIPVACDVHIEVLNGLGQAIAILTSQELPPGHYETTWNARNIASGTYYCRMRAGSFVQTRKLVLIK